MISAELLLGVSGRPILHSVSPIIHRAALRSVGQTCASVRIAAGDAAEALSLGAELELRAMSITAPFKEDCARMVPCGDEEAADTGAVNLVTWDGGQPLGYNTDVFGVQAALGAACGGSLQDKHVLVIGAGGAARAAVYALWKSGAHVVVSNRSIEAAQRITARFGGIAVELGTDESTDAISRAEIIVACAATGEELIPPHTVEARHVVLESYYAKPSALLAAASQAGSTIVLPHEWLIHQAVRAVEIATGRTPTPDPLRAALADDAASRVSREGNRIAIIGCMGAGKTAVSRELGERLGLPVVSLDAEIERRSGRQIVELFAHGGEQHFREIEREVLAEISLQDSFILDCGGGVVVEEENRRVLAERFDTTWLWAAPDVLASRIAGHDVPRPLLAGRNPLHALSEILKERHFSYASCAQLVVGTAARTAREVAQLIAYEISSSR